MARGSTYNVRARMWLTDQGYDCIAKVEWFNHYTKHYRDLFGVFDFLAVGMGHTVGVQVTSRSNLASRRKKLQANTTVPLLQANGWRVLLLGFDQPAGPRTAWRAHAEFLE